MYAHIVHGGVVRFYSKIPFTFNGVSGFSALTDQQRENYGFVAVTDATDLGGKRLTKGKLSISVEGKTVTITRPTKAE